MIHRALGVPNGSAPLVVQNIAVNGPAPRRCPRGPGQSLRESAFLADPSAVPCRASRFERRSRQSPLGVRFGARQEARCQVHLPNGDGWLAGHKQQWQCGNGLASRLARQRPDGEVRDPIRLVPVSQPTKSRPAKLPLNAFQHSAGAGRYKFVVTQTQLVADTIHRVGYVVTAVPCQVLLQRVANQLIAGSPGSLGQAFGPCKNLVARLSEETLNAS